MGTIPRLTLWYLVLTSLLIPATRQDKDSKKHEKGKGSERHRSGEEAVREGLRCYKCDPTENNNYCRDFKPKLATPYDCTLTPENSKTAKTQSPLSVVVNPERPFSCYKVKGDAAYGHGKVYGAKRYGCGHITKVRTINVTTGDSECADARMTTKGKDFFDGIVCNCDNADGCNSASKASLRTVELLLTLTFFLRLFSL